jgi:hypothetical protein
MIWHYHFLLDASRFTVLSAAGCNATRGAGLLSQPILVVKAGNRQGSLSG